jgi:hypothetical protein
MPIAEDVSSVSVTYLPSDAEPPSEAEDLIRIVESQYYSRSKIPKHSKKRR